MSIDADLESIINILEYECKCYDEIEKLKKHTEAIKNIRYSVEQLKEIFPERVKQTKELCEIIDKFYV